MQRALSPGWKRGALVAYLVGGYPDLEGSLEAVGAVVKGGADLVELGIPFSDPIADGRTIQAAGASALAAGVRPGDVMRIAAEARARYDVPVVLMTYYNIVYANGVERFLREAKKMGVDGVIVPDLPFDESEAYSRLSRKVGVDAILLAAPTTPDARMRKLVERTSGFLYLVSLLGVTGARASLGGDTTQLISRVRRLTERKVPLGVGFGISRPEHVREVIAAGGDAAIVGSALVDLVSKHQRDRGTMARELELFVRSMSAATRAT